MTAWTTPRTWVSGEVLTSSNFNTHIRDNMISYGGADAISTTPPASPGNGQRWVYPYDAANGVYWQFIYLAAISAWVFTGGSPAYANVDTSQNTTTPFNTYADLATAGPTITLARAGDYLIEIGCRPDSYDGNTNSAKYMSFAVGATAATDADAAVQNMSGSGPVPYHSVSNARVKTGIAASTAITAKYRSGAANASNFAYRWMRIVPRKVT